jgi:hypothetical protein
MVLYSWAVPAELTPRRVLAPPRARGVTGEVPPPRSREPEVREVAPVPPLITERVEVERRPEVLLPKRISPEARVLWPVPPEETPRALVKVRVSMREEVAFKEVSRESEALKTSMLVVEALSTERRASPRTVRRVVEARPVEVTRKGA